MSDSDSRTEDQPPPEDDADLKQAVEALMLMQETAGWKILLNRFEAEVGNAFDEFTDIDPTDTVAIMACQNKAKMFRQLIETPDELIQEGLQVEDFDEIENEQAAESEPED